jgi:hypothetical protein
MPKQLLSSPKQVKVLGQAKKSIGLPPTERWGEAVPKGGSSCSNCEYLKDAEKMLCGQEDFIVWNGSSKIPAGKPDEYCSIWWEGSE